MKNWAIKMAFAFLISAFLPMGFAFEPMTGILDAKPKIETNSGYSYLHLTGSNSRETLIFSWPRLNTQTAPKIALDLNRTYKFSYVKLSMDGFRSQLTSIKLGTNIVYDAAICEAHPNIGRMTLKKAPIRYGLQMPVNYGLTDEKYYEVELKRFPFHRELSFGGCAVSRDSPKESLVWVCDSCKKAFQEWASAHPIKTNKPSQMRKL